MFLPALIVTTAIIATSIAMIGVRIFFVKGSVFRGSRAIKDREIKNDFGECSDCGS